MALAAIAEESLANGLTARGGSRTLSSKVIVGVAVSTAVLSIGLIEGLVVGTAQVGLFNGSSGVQSGLINAGRAVEVSKGVEAYGLTSSACRAGGLSCGSRAGKSAVVSPRGFDGSTVLVDERGRGSEVLAPVVLAVGVRTRGSYPVGEASLVVPHTGG